jgi:hypothetical protein
MERPYFVPEGARVAGEVRHHLLQAQAEGPADQDGQGVAMMLSTTQEVQTIARRVASIAALRGVEMTENDALHFAAGIIEALTGRYITMQLINRAKGMADVARD